MKHKKALIITIITIVVLAIAAVTAIVIVNTNSASPTATMLTTAERYLRELNYEQATIEFQRIIEIDPMNADAYEGLIEAYEAIGDRDKAEDTRIEAYRVTRNKSFNKIIILTTGITTGTAEIATEGVDNSTTTAAASVTTTASTTAATSKTTSEIAVVSEEAVLSTTAPQTSPHTTTQSVTLVPSETNSDEWIYGYKLTDEDKEFIQNQLDRIVCWSMNREDDYCLFKEGEITEKQALFFTIPPTGGEIPLTPDIVIPNHHLYPPDTDPLGLFRSCQYYDGKDIDKFLYHTFGIEASHNVITSDRYYYGSFYYLNELAAGNIHGFEYISNAPTKDGRLIVECAFGDYVNSDDINHDFLFDYSKKVYALVSVHESEGNKYFRYHAISNIKSDVMPAGEIAATQTTAQTTNSKPKKVKIGDEEYSTDLTELVIDKIFNDLNNDDIKNLKYMTKLNDVTIVNCKEISDLSPFSTLLDLERIIVGGTSISDISPLCNISNLRTLSLGWNKISDISPISNLNNLEGIRLSRNPISDISPLSNLKKLEWLLLDEIQISDISLLSNLKKLEHLRLDKNQISDIRPLSNLKKLEKLWLDKNQISDISPLSKLTDLELLYLDENQISDISPLSKLKNLRILSLSENEISDISPLYKLTNLEELHIKNNNLSESQINKLKKKLPDCDIYY